MTRLSLAMPTMTLSEAKAGRRTIYRTGCYSGIFLSARLSMILLPSAR